MGKLILFSVILANILLPIIAAKDRHPRRGLKKAVVYTTIFNAFYAFAVLFIYPRL